MYALPLLLSLAAPQGGDDLAIVRRAEADRTAVVGRVAAAVCSVMPVKSAGGGSGIIIDPAGFVLTNFHVVQRRQKKKGNKPEDDMPKMPGGPPDPVEPPELPLEKMVPLHPGEEEPAGKKRSKLLPLDPSEVPLPRPRYPKIDEDYDPDDPAWAVMKIGMPDGELYLADVLGIDPGSDLAILLLRPRADGMPYPFARLGDSDQLLVGETVFAMGNPFLLATDFSPTVTWGVVSGTHRYQPGGGNRFLVYPDCIQVDAPVNPGNSGGPLFNEAGKVVGINGRISVRDRGRVNTGVGFAIASNQIRHFLGDMMAGRHAEHGTLDLNAWFMDSPDGKGRGVFVQATFADSIATKLGVGLGDELVSFNGMEVRSANQLATLVGVLPAGSWVSLTYRPLRKESDTFGPKKTIVFQLTRLDTGSSREEDRIGTEAHRRLAREALTTEVGAGEDTAGAVSVELLAPGPRRVTVQRLGDKLRWDDGSMALVRTGPGAGFAIERGAVRSLTAEEQAKLERSFTTNPKLWSGADRKKMIADARLEGGVLVFGKPARRFRLPGAGEREVFLYEDGLAAGCRYRDPVAKAVVEYRFDRDHARVRVVIDGELQEGWAISAATSLPSPSLFERTPR